MTRAFQIPILKIPLDPRHQSCRNPHSHLVEPVTPRGEIVYAARGIIETQVVCPLTQLIHCFYPGLLSVDGDESVVLSTAAVYGTVQPVGKNKMLPVSVHPIGAHSLRSTSVQIGKTIVNLVTPVP